MKKTPFFAKKLQKSEKKLQKKFGSKGFCRTFAIPNQTSGGGEMVDTLL